MRTIQKNNRRRTKTRGAAVAELAVTLPVPLLFLLGTIDTGQFANVYQTISNASLEGARVASKSSTDDVASIKAAVVAYLDGALANIDSSELSSVVSITVTDETNGTTLSSSLASVTAGSKLRINVSMPYSAVRYISGLNALNAQIVQTSTAIKRQ